MKRRGHETRDIETSGHETRGSFRSCLVGHCLVGHCLVVSHDITSRRTRHIRFSGRTPHPKPASLARAPRGPPADSLQVQRQRPTTISLSRAAYPLYRSLPAARRGAARPCGATALLQLLGCGRQASPPACPAPLSTRLSTWIGAYPIPAPIHVDRRGQAAPPACTARRRVCLSLAQRSTRARNGRLGPVTVDSGP